MTMALAGVLLIMVNYLSFRTHWRVDVSTTRYYSLSDQSRTLMNEVQEPIDVYLLMRKDHEAFEDVERLLREYASLSGQMSVHGVDLQRDVSLIEELKGRYEVTEEDVVLLAVGDRRRIIPAADFYTEQDSGLNETTPIRSFRGEQLISSAVQELVEGKSARIYFTQGHGEHDLESFEGQQGYSGIARVMKQENFLTEKLVLGTQATVPADADAVVIAGPKKPFSGEEAEALFIYLANGGRIMFLLDALVESGLEKKLKTWGVDLRDDLVVDAARTLTGKELFITSYDPHPITSKLSGLTSVFYLPRSVRAADSSAMGDNPGGADWSFTSLASCSENGWSETDLLENPKRFDPLRDAPGPVPVAAAIEKGPGPRLDVNLSLCRLVVFGDSDFVSNAGLNGGDVDFFMNALDWILEREPLISIRPRNIETVKLVMDKDQTRRFMLLVAGGLPSLAAFLGLFTWAIRRRR